MGWCEISREIDVNGMNTSRSLTHTLGGNQSLSSSDQLPLKTQVLCWRWLRRHTPLDLESFNSNIMWNKIGKCETTSKYQYKDACDSIWNDFGFDSHSI